MNSISNQIKIQPEIMSRFEPYVAEIRPKMILFVQRQLIDRSKAEDLVQEALIGAFQNADRFRGEAALKTWIFAILRRKIADYYRQEKRTPTSQVAVESIGVNDESQENLDLLFDHKGRWHPHFKPIDWGDPEEELSNKQFWVIFDTCLNELPEKQCTAFMMREYIGLTTEEIRSELGMTVSLLNVTLHRARLRLQQCLSIRWFGDAL